jgi:hypothetical protein
MPAIKIRRPGINRIFKKVKLTLWLEQQPRKLLTYSKKIVNPEGTGWTTQDLLLEGLSRGVPLTISTIQKWRAGSVPRALRQMMEEKFDGIQI